MDISKFSWAEGFSNNNGKTSLSGISGFSCIIVGLIGFLSAILITEFGAKETGAGLSIFQYSSGLVLMGSSLIGIRKVSSNGNVEISGDVKGLDNFKDLKESVDEIIK